MEGFCQEPGLGRRKKRCKLESELIHKKSR